MKVKHNFLVCAAAFMMVMPAWAKSGVVYQSQDSIKCFFAPTGKGDEEETCQLDDVVRKAVCGCSLCGRHSG